MPVPRRQSASSTTAATYRATLDAALEAAGYEALRGSRPSCDGAASIAASASPATSRARPSAPTRAPRHARPHRPRGGRDGRGVPGPGPRDRVRAGRRRRARRPARLGDDRGRRHGGDSLRRRHLRQPERGERRQLDPGRVRARCATSWPPPPRRCWRPRPRTWRSRTAWRSFAARPRPAVPLARVIQAADPHLREGRASPRRTSTPPCTTTCRRSRTRRRCTWRTWRWTPARARSAAPLPRLPRLRARHQPHDRGGADPRRRRPGRGRRALRGDGLRRRGPAPDRHADGLPGARRRPTCRPSSPSISSSRRRATRSASRASARAAPSRRPRPSRTRWRTRWRRSACA